MGQGLPGGELRHGVGGQQGPQRRGQVLGLAAGAPRTPTPRRCCRPSRCRTRRPVSTANGSSCTATCPPRRT
ncbi:hypothetical protein DLE01_41630, partial [Streptomyces sp. FT05W]